MVKTIITRYELRKHMNEGHESTKQASASTGTAGQLQGKRVQQNLENKCIPRLKKGKGNNIGDGDLEEQCNRVRPKRGRKRKNYNEITEETENNEGRKRKNYDETNEEDENKEHENAKGPEEVESGSKSLKTQNRGKKKGSDNYDGSTNILNETLVVEGEHIRAAEGLGADLVGGCVGETKTNKEDKVKKRRGRKRKEEKNVSSTSIETLMAEEEEDDVSLGARKAKRRRKREDKHAGDLTLTLEESLIGDVVDKEEEEKEEELVELMASNVFWDKGKQERFEQISAEDQETNKPSEHSFERSLLAANEQTSEAGSDWHSSCKRITSRSRQIKDIFVADSNCIIDKYCQV